MGDYKNVSKLWKFGLLGLPDGSINIGVGGKLQVNFRRNGDKGEGNWTLTFGENAYIAKPEYNNDRFFFECLDPMLMPPDLCFAINMLGAGSMDMDSMSGGSMEGTYFGRSRWKRFTKDGITHTGIVVGTCETDYKKSGKAAWMTWIYPSEGLFAKGTFIHIYHEWELKPLPPIPVETASITYPLTDIESVV